MPAEKGLKQIERNFGKIRRKCLYHIKNKASIMCLCKRKQM
ncbi:hypothetical protein CLOHYLEM_07421 [[Clostridium] hylemonae DSM 15053]|uniref:Uncharacterized protein n=1 Tax=[Clostridium] hylemonae DSM 15053 TaxID=553973 RepID=C0C5N4_9FIRM|nr:hypothetical protein CLOHYLEM_07421 [[Clostridium] hylemonae DSM 15053]